MAAKVILNPYSGRWSALKRKDEATAALREAGIEFELALTEGPQHGIELAEQAARAGFSPIISAGGDGATGEVINGLHRAAPDGVPACSRTRLRGYVTVRPSDVEGVAS